MFCARSISQVPLLATSVIEPVQRSTKLVWVATVENETVAFEPDSLVTSFDRNSIYLSVYCCDSKAAKPPS